MFIFFFRAHEQFGYCQAGTSGILTSEDRVVIGTPGPHTWRGTVYIFSVSDEFLSRDNTAYHAPMQDASPVSKYSYLGKIPYQKNHKKKKENKRKAENYNQVHEILEIISINRFFNKSIV